MDTLRQYVLSITTAAIVSGILLSLCPKGSFSGLLKLLCGVFLTVTVIYPVTGFHVEQWLSEFAFHYDLDGKAAAAFGEETSRDLLAERIQEETEAYILDKATRLGAVPEVTVTVGEGSPPVPVSVTIRGSIPPYIKQQLEHMISEDIGISKENQRWTG